MPDRRQSNREHGEGIEPRMSGFVEKLLFVALSVIIGWQQIQAGNTRADVQRLEERVLHLYTNTVTKSELKDTEERITKNVEAIRVDIKGILQLYIGNLVTQKK